MGSDRYFTGIIVRVILIVVSALLLAFLAFRTNYLYSILVVSILITAETLALIRFILKQRNDIKRMLEYIRENNPSIYFSGSREYPFKELGYFLNEIGDIVRAVRIDKEGQLQYMNYIVQHVGTGLLSFDKEGRVDIINQAARDLLGVGEISSVSVLELVHHGLPEILMKIKVGEQKVINLKAGSYLRQLAIRISIFTISKKEIRLASFQDIKNELDEKEMESWQKLIRVLTHEIINSITPVTALTSTISGFFKKDNIIVAASDLPDESIREALTGLGYIEDRGKNLIDFVSKFRSLTKLPAPKFGEVKLSKLIDTIMRFRKADLYEKGITLKSTIEGEDLRLICDHSLIEQVLLNLVNNASDSLLEGTGINEKIIEITGKTADNDHPRIMVRDNGKGIGDELLENIFIPFYTTRENGSGIGLSLARQIMKLHGGSISVMSKPGIETVFSLNF